MFSVSSSVDPNAGPRRRPYNSLSMPAVAAAGPGQGDYGNHGGGGGYPPAGGGYGGPAGGYGGGYEPGYGQGGGGYQDDGGYGGYPDERYGHDRGYADQGSNGYGPPATVPPPAYQQQQRLRHLLTVDGSQQWLELQVGSNVIGRGQDADLRLPDTGVSRRHVDIRFDGTGAVLHDLGSTNGTTVNGHRAQSWQLQHGDVVRLGHTVVVYRQEPV
jgi:hypothetical protein